MGPLEEQSIGSGCHTGTNLIPAPGWIYGRRADFIAVIGNLRALHQQPDVRRSDHRPFWDAGYRVVMVTDTSFLRNPNYHRLSDTIATLNLDFFMRVTEGLVRALSAV